MTWPDSLVVNIRTVAQPHFPCLNGLYHCFAPVGWHLIDGRCWCRFLFLMDESYSIPLRPLVSIRAYCVSHVMLAQRAVSTGIRSLSSPSALCGGGLAQHPFRCRLGRCPWSTRLASSSAPKSSQTPLVEHSASPHRASCPHCWSAGEKRGHPARLGRSPV